MRRWNMAVGVAAFLLCIGAVYLGWQRYAHEMRYEHLYETALNAVAQGNGSEAIAILEPLAASTSSAPEFVRVKAETTLAAAFFATGEQTDQVRGIGMLKELALEPSHTAAERAYAMDEMFNFYYIDRSPETFAAIFDGPPFAAFNQPDVREKDALKSAFEYEWAVYPTALNALHIANWYAGELLDGHLDASKRSSYIATLQALRTKGERMHDQSQSFGVEAVRTPDDVIFENLDAFLCAVLALQKAQAPSFDARYAALEHALSQQDNTSLRPFLPYVLMYHAAFLDMVYGQDRRQDVVALSNELATLLQSEPVAATYFKRLVAVEAVAPASGRDHDYAFLAALAGYSPALKKILVQYGFTP